MQSAEIRKRFIAFFKARGHAEITSASLITSDEKGLTNPTLFNTAGMQPLIPYLLGKPHPLGKRLVDVQKCLRTVDIDDIGDKTHATFFEMLGNWSLGDYFKKEAIEWSYEFLTSKSEVDGQKGLGLDPNRLYVTVFEGDRNAPRDNEAAQIWKDIFKEKNIRDGEGDTTKGEAGRIFYLPAENNWWEAGDNGPCGPDSEMFYDVTGKFGGRPLTKEEYLKADEDHDVVEVWNDVFMQYEKKDGKIIGNLPKPSIDTGAGLERLAMVMQKVDSIYKTDLLGGASIFALTLNPNNVSSRIIADHLRSAVFLIADGVKPSNSFRGYVLRKLIRRAIFSIQNKTIKKEETTAFVDIIINTYDGVYDLKTSRDLIIGIISDEATQFDTTLKQGLREFERIAPNSQKQDSSSISGHDAFVLFSTYGFPLEITKELAKERKLSVDEAGYNEEFKKHQKLSRSGAEQKFKGGLADSNDPMVVRYHTATHLLHQALHDVLGEGVGQKGSNITDERLRFDFSYPIKLTDEQKKKVEEIINKKIVEALPVNKVSMTLAEAEKTGARHFFGEKYGDEVSIYYVGNDLNSAYSKEFCGGPHVSNTKDLAGPEGQWRFKITKEEAVAQGIRRIKATLL